MTHLLLLIISSSIVSNVVLSQFLGLCPFLGVSKKTDTAIGMGAAVIFVITIASLVTALIYRYILTDMYPDIDEYLKSHGVIRGIQDLRLDYSYFKYDGDLTVTLTYNFHWLKVPFSDEWLGGKRIVCSASTRAWRP